jgi:hypothetical protein
MPHPALAWCDRALIQSHDPNVNDDACNSDDDNDVQHLWAAPLGGTLVEQVCHCVPSAIPWHHHN